MVAVKVEEIKRYLLSHLAALEVQDIQSMSFGKLEESYVPNV